MHGTVGTARRICYDLTRFCPPLSVQRILLRHTPKTLTYCYLIPPVWHTLLLIQQQAPAGEDDISLYLCPLYFLLNI